MKSLLAASALFLLTRVALAGSSDAGIYDGRIATATSKYPKNLAGEDITSGKDEDFVDKNGNGIDDNWEMRILGDLSGAHLDDDYDGDGLTNRREYEFGSDPLSYSTANDGVSDGWKVANKFSPKTVVSTARDGIPNSWKVQHGYNARASIGDEDDDYDGLTNMQEFQLGTDPSNPDTDGDGLKDGADTNPTAYNPSPPHHLAVVAPTAATTQTYADYTTATLTWTVDNPDHITGFLIERKVSTGEWEKWKENVAGTARSYALADLLAQRNYRYRVTAFNEQDAIKALSSVSNTVVYQIPHLLGLDVKLSRGEWTKPEFKQFNRPTIDITDDIYADMAYPKDWTKNYYGWGMVNHQWWGPVGGEDHYGAQEVWWLMAQRLLSASEESFSLQRIKYKTVTAPSAPISSSCYMVFMPSHPDGTPDISKPAKVVKSYTSIEGIEDEIDPYARNDGNGTYHLVFPPSFTAYGADGQLLDEQEKVDVGVVLQSVNELVPATPGNYKLPTTHVYYEGALNVRAPLVPGAIATFTFDNAAATLHVVIHHPRPHGEEVRELHSKDALMMEELRIATITLRLDAETMTSLTNLTSVSAVDAFGNSLSEMSLH